ILRRPVVNLHPFSVAERARVVEDDLDDAGRMHVMQTQLDLHMRTEAACIGDVIAERSTRWVCVCEYRAEVLPAECAAWQFPVDKAGVYVELRLIRDGERQWCHRVG